MNKNKERLKDLIDKLEQDKQIAADNGATDAVNAIINEQWLLMQELHELDN